MYRDPGAWNALMERLADATALYLNAQAAAGAQALQLFDSWVGTLEPGRLPPVRPAAHDAALRAARPVGAGDPLRHRTPASLLELQRDAGGSVIGLDWRVELDRRLAAARPRRRRPGQSRSRRPARPRERRSSARPGASSPRPPAGPAISSTSATASCRTPPSTTSWRS